MYLLSCLWIHYNSLFPSLSSNLHFALLLFLHVLFSPLEPGLFHLTIPHTSSVLNNCCWISLNRVFEPRLAVKLHFNTHTFPLLCLWNQFKQYLGFPFKPGASAPHPGPHSASWSPCQFCEVDGSQPGADWSHADTCPLPQIWLCPYCDEFNPRETVSPEYLEFSPFIFWTRLNTRCSWDSWQPQR